MFFLDREVLELIGQNRSFITRWFKMVSPLPSTLSYYFKNTNYSDNVTPHEFYIAILNPIFCNNCIWFGRTYKQSSTIVDHQLVHEQESTQKDLANLKKKKTLQPSHNTTIFSQHDNNTTIFLHYNIVRETI